MLASLPGLARDVLAAIRIHSSRTLTTSGYDLMRPPLHDMPTGDGAPAVPIAAKRYAGTVAHTADLATCPGVRASSDTGVTRR